MKKSLISLIIFILIASLCGIANAYSTSQFSIDIPETWKSTTTNSFVDGKGNNVNIQITKTSFGSGNPYTETNLNKLVDEIYNNVDSYKDEMVQSLKQSYGAYLTEKEIREYVSSFKCNSVDVKEITTCTKNNYKCFHIIANYTMSDYSYYCDQYCIVSDKTIFTLSVSAGDKKDFENAELRGIVDSFTINNYKEPSSFPLSPVLTGALIGACVGAVIGLISYIVKNKNKQKESQNQDENKNETENKND